MANFVLTKDHSEIHGEFWIPGEDSRSVGYLRLEAGKSPCLELAEFTGLGRSAIVESILRRQSRRHGDGHRVMHGNNEYGQPITLIDCYETSSHSTRSRLTRTISCRAAIFGEHLLPNDLLFLGITFRVDHQDEWLDRSALGQLQFEPEDLSTIRTLKIPVAESKSINLNLADYSRSDFSLTWSIGPHHRNISLKARSYLNLDFEKTKTWDETLAELSSWEQFFSLAMRSNIGPQEISLDRPVSSSAPSSKNKPLSVWIDRQVGPEVVHPKRSSQRFHFSFSDIESSFAEVHGRWRSIAESWTAVLHRFSAISSPRKLWSNEEFLFLAQAIESLHRARSGKDAQISFLSAAYQAWDKSPAELQLLLGKRDLFANTLRKTRNYWTHYGKPSPADDAEILDGDELIVFNDKLRWIVEAAILLEIGIPAGNVARVWSEHWRLEFVNYV